MSTRIFAAYLNKIGVKARQVCLLYDFTNADILEATYPAVAKRLNGDWIRDPAIPIDSGFLGKIFYLHNFFSFYNLLHYNNVWKDVDGVLTCDPNIYSGAEPVPYLTFDEAAELA
ncbi:hypothetical protein L1987_73030 [Smallanthus sonchifolius]|uniref:Uncharacterized protein n=1 Tax=Smallanthus sonchifolius TaxID=185202 RepID=A0ACB9AXJ4_9ASTR|nr:hypothetical protein L1987_73030 [Smallanthus sonchifolius]